MHRFKPRYFGTGFVGPRPLEAIRRLGFVDIYALGEAELKRPGSLPTSSVEKVEADYRKFWTIPPWMPSMCARPTRCTSPWRSDALQAGKHVICEKPLAISVAEARQLVALAPKTERRNCTFHNLRFYPMVQQMRRMREAASWARSWSCKAPTRRTGCSTIPTGTGASNSKVNGPSRCMADIGSHWCDMAEHITGLRITSLCADLQTFHKTRKRPKGSIETFAGKTLKPEDYQEVRHRHRRFRRRDIPHGRPHARGLHRQPGFGRTQERSEHRNLRHRKPAWPGTRNAPMSCGSASATSQQPDPREGSVPAEGGRALLRRSTWRPQRRLRRHLQAVL